MAMNDSAYADTQEVGEQSEHRAFWVTYDDGVIIDILHGSVVSW